MKQLLTIQLAALLIWGAQAVAQPKSEMAEPQQNLKVVPTLGYTYFNIEGSNQSFKSKGGNSIGVLAQMPLSENLDFEGGLEYMETGAKLSVSFGFLDLDYATINIANLAIPLRAKYLFNPGSEGTRYYGKGGLTPTYILSAKSETIEGTNDIKSELNAFGALAQVGFGADWSVYTGRLSADLTYNYGLTKLEKDNGGRSTGYQIQMGYAIAL